MFCLSLPSHGSNPNYLYEYYNLKKPDEVIDFSVNTNPLGMPESLKDRWPKLIQKVSDYPDPQSKELLNSLSEKINIDRSHLLLGNGAAELISLLAFYLQRKAVLIIQPTFSEYERMCRAHDCEITYHTIQPEESICLKEFEQAVKNKDAVFLCNPNNPTGKYMRKETLKKMAAICLQNDCLFIVDEAFYDFLIDYDDVIDLHEQYSNMIVLRSLTKMYSIAGLRLGYLVAQPLFIERVQKYLPHWHINAIASAAGDLCLKETEFVVKTQDYILKERNEIYEALEGLDFKVVKSEVNYYLMQDQLTSDIQLLFIYLLKLGIVLRHTENFPGLNGKWLRVAVKSETENRTLLEALKRWRQIN